MRFVLFPRRPRRTYRRCRRQVHRCRDDVSVNLNKSIVREYDFLEGLCCRRSVRCRTDRGSLPAYILILNVRNGQMDDDDDDNIGRVAF